MKKLILGVILTSVVFGISWYQYGMSRPIFRSDAGISDITTKGHPDEAMQRAKKLADALKKVGWDTTKVPFELKVLPDQEMAEDKNYRSQKGSDGAMIQVSPWCFVPTDDPILGEVALYTDLYVKKNIVIYKNEKGDAAPEGFFIVCYRDGTVAKVPVKDVKVVYRPGTIKEKSYVFPGTKLYKPTLESLYAAKAN